MLKTVIENAQELAAALRDPDVRARRKALRSIVSKNGNRIVLKFQDPQMIPVLRNALHDPDERVKGGAAYALRPWTKEDPGLFSSVLPEYAIQTFDGTYTHVGLLDTRTGDIWVPPWQSLKGHAALMSDGNTDQYFKFQFYLANQAPPRPRATAQCESDAHLMVNYICDWSYSSQSLVADAQSREGMDALAEQEAFERSVIAFYGGCELPFAVQVHRTYWLSDSRPKRQYATSRIESGLGGFRR